LISRKDAQKLTLLPRDFGAQGRIKKHSSNSLTDDTSGTSGSGSGIAGDTSSAVQIFYCYGPEGDMIACDNPECPFKWFHITCLQIERFPKGKVKWCCLDCKVLPQFQVRYQKKGDQLLYITL